MLVNKISASLLAIVLSSAVSASEVVSVDELTEVTDGVTESLKESLEESEAQNNEALEAIGDALEDSVEIDSTGYASIVTNLTSFLNLGLIDFASEDEQDLDTVIENEVYRTWADQNNVNPDLFAAQLLRLEMLFAIHSSVLEQVAAVEAIGTLSQTFNQEMQMQELVGNAISQVADMQVTAVMQGDLKSAAQNAADSDSEETIDDFVEILKDTNEMSKEQMKSMGEQKEIANSGLAELQSQMIAASSDIMNMFSSSEKLLIKEVLQEYSSLRKANGL
ncbi:hypothetical protein N8144_07750 [Planktomarina temperata]|nr:hypothetical protein [Planktomarina temperata]